MTNPHINQLREHLMSTLASLRDRANPMEPDRARAVAQVAGVLVDTAKVEIDYLRATGGDSAAFMAQPSTIEQPSTTVIESEVPKTTFVGGANPFARLGARA